jgi:nucleotide-binding universal stress UspA family protein
MDEPVTADPEEHFGPSEDRPAFERGTDGPRVIMVGVDGSPTSGHATAYACGMARRQRCRLVVVYVAPAVSFGASMSGVMAAAVVDTLHELTDELRTDVRRIAEEFGVPTTFITRRGDPYAQLRDTADAVKADMVVVGASTQAGHWLIGSVARGSSGSAGGRSWSCPEPARRTGRPSRWLGARPLPAETRG